MKLLTVNLSDKPEKKLVATFQMADGKEKKVHFGSKNSTTYVEGADKKKREAYLSRHQVNEDWTIPDTPGSLSRYILWGDSVNVNKNIAHYRLLFGI